MPPPRPLFLLFMLLAARAAAPPVARTAEVQAEIDALLAFWSGLRDPYAAMSGWDAASPSSPCSWLGVACVPGTSRVVELLLPRLRLSGSISPALASLTYLEKLSLRSNSLSGTIPAPLARISSLRLLHQSARDQLATDRPAQSPQSDSASIRPSSGSTFFLQQPSI